MITKRPIHYPSIHAFGVHRRSRFVVLLLLVLLTTMASAQQPTPMRGPRSTAPAGNRTGAIKGRVTDDAGQPFANIVVCVSPIGGTYEQRREVASDEAGNFQVDGLPFVAYTVGCAAEGYVEDGDDDSHAYHLTGDSVALRLRKGGVISGTVSNAAGEPLIKAQIVSVRVRDADGHPVRDNYMRHKIESDDRGIYRIYGLEAGSYLVGLQQTGEYEDAEQRSDVPIFYPSATLAGAQAVKVFRGAETSGINLIHRRVIGHRISGKVLGAAKKESSGTEAYLKLLRLPGGFAQQGDWAGYQTNGTFAIHGVPDGDYLLIAQDDTDEPGAASLPVRITVRGSDVSGLALTILPFASIAGRVLLQPTLPASAECKSTRPARIEEMVIAATRQEQMAPGDWLNQLFDATITGAPTASGDFLLPQIAPGSYRLAAELLNDNLYVRTITRPAAKHNASQSATAASHLVALTSGEQMKEILITIANGAASLQGRIVAASTMTKLPERMTIHLVPAERERADDILRYDETVASGDGGFTFKHLAPGRYWLVARAADEKRSAQAPVALEPASRAALRHEAEATGATLDLQPCQRASNITLRYPLATKPASQ